MLATFKKQLRQNLILWLGLLFFLVMLGSNMAPQGEQQFAYLADSFLHLKSYFISMPGSWWDTSYINGQHYWPLGPFPAVVLMPFVFLAKSVGIFFYQGYLNFFIGVAVFYLVYLLAKALGYQKNDRLFWAFAFCFVSPFIGVFHVPWSWNFAQVIATCLVLLFIHLSLNTKGREWLLGTIIAVLLATRPLAAFACILFVIFNVFATRKKFLDGVNYLSKIFIASPFLPLAGLWLLYNQLSFGHLFSAGYKEQILWPAALNKAREYGLFSVRHIPTNLYYSLLSLPQPVFLEKTSKMLTFPYLAADHWGTSLFFVSPYLFYLFLIDYKEKIMKILLAVSLITFLPITMYYGIGFRQYGYRYALDFFPFLFLLLMIGYKNKYGKLNNTTKALIAVFAFINLWFMFTVF